MAQKKSNKPSTTAADAAVVVDVINETAVETVEDTKPKNNKPAKELKNENQEIVDTLEEIKSIVGDGAHETEVRVIKNRLESTDKIPCKSLFYGKLIYVSPTNGAKYIWNSYGAIQHIPLGELETMNNHKPDYLNKPLLVVLEPTVVEDFNFKNIYQKVASFNKLDGLLEGNNVEVIRAKVKELIEVGMRDSVIAEVRKKRKDDKLVNINIINMLKAELKTDFE